MRALSILVLFALWYTAEAQQFRRPQPVTSVSKQFSAIWKLDRAPQPIISGTNAIPAIVRVNSHSLILFAEETKKRKEKNGQFSSILKNQECLCGRKKYVQKKEKVDKRWNKKYHHTRVV